MEANGVSVVAMNRHNGVPDEAAMSRPSDELERLASLRRYRRDQQIYGQEDRADCWYRVVSGVLRRFVVRANGRRQIVDFLLPGDFFGFAAGADRHTYSVEAVGGGTVVASYSRRRVEELAETDPAVARLIRRQAFDTIARLQEQIRILGRTRAPEKVGCFLLEMATRYASGSDRILTLPISRYDIADYLSLSVETVSRAMTRLRARGAIALVGARKVTILDREAMREPPPAEDQLPELRHREAVARAFAGFAGEAERSWVSRRSS